MRFRYMGEVCTLVLFISIVLEAALDPPVLLKRFWRNGDAFDPQAPTNVFAVSY